jgi:hypothetical protein
MANKRSGGKPGSKRTKDLPVRSAGKVKGGSQDSLDSRLGTMSDLGQDIQISLQQAVTQATAATAAQANVLKKTSDSQTAIIKNLKG